MKSSELLLFIKERFVNVYKEHPNTDYLIALKNLADEINDKDFKISFLQGQNNELSAENQFLNDEYQQFIEMLPNDARYLDLPDGGSVHPSEQMRRMLADLNNKHDGLLSQVSEQQSFIESVMANIGAGATLAEVTDMLCNWYDTKVPPTQHLLNIQAEAGRAGFVAGATTGARSHPDEDQAHTGYLLGLDADQYAERVKAGEK